MRVIIHGTQAVRTEDAYVVIEGNPFELLLHFDAFFAHLTETGADDDGMTDFLSGLLFEDV